MDITFNCTKCGQHIVIDSGGAGMFVNCPKCATPLLVPSKSVNRAAMPSSLPEAKVSPPSSAPPPDKKCPFCAEMIHAEAIKCKHCGEFLNGAPKTQRPPPHIPTAVPPAISKPIPKKRKRPTGLIVGVAVVASLALIGLIGQFSDEKAADSQRQAEKAASRTFTARYIRDSGGFLGLGSTWIVESSEDKENGFHSYAGENYYIYVYPSPHAAYKGSGLVSGDRLTFRASFSGYEKLVSPNGLSGRMESWRPIEQ